MRLSDIERWDNDEADRLRPCGLDPRDDALEAQANEQAEIDRRQDHAPARQRAHTRCECGALEKGYRHPGHDWRCPRFSRRYEISEIR